MYGIHPAGTLVKLQQGLRTQALINPKDLSLADVRRMVVTVDGVPVPDVAYTGVEYDGKRRIVVRFLLPGALRFGQRTRVTLPYHPMALSAVVERLDALSLTLRSTARSMMLDRLGGGKVPEAGLDILEKCLENAFLSQGDPFNEWGIELR